MALPPRLTVTAASKAEVTDAVRGGARLWRALAWVLRWELVVAVVFRVLSEAATATTPLLVQQCIRVAQGDARAGTGLLAQPLWLGFALFLSSMLQFTALNQYIYRCFTSAHYSRALLAAIVYDKALRLTRAARGDPGSVVQLVGKDAEAAESFMIFAHNVWSAPLSALVSCAMLYHFLGSPVLVGLLVTLVAIPVEMAVTRWSKRLSKATAAYTDERLRFLVNTLTGIRYIKISALEPYLRQLIDRERTMELATILHSSFVRALNVFVMSLTPVAVAVATLLCARAWSGGPLAADMVFPALVLFGGLGHPFKIWPKSVQLLSSFLVSCERIEAFLARAETPALPPAMVPSALNNSAGRITVHNNK